MSNALVADELNELGDLIELSGGDQFRARAYHNAARTISQMSKDVVGMVLHDDDLTQLPGIGESISEKIQEIALTGTCKVLEKARHEVPPGLTELLKVPGLGAHRVRMLNDELGIHTKVQLAEAASHGKVRGLKGFGAKLESKILQAVQAAPKGRRFKLMAVEKQAQTVLAYIQALPGVKQAIIAGSYRRCKETVGDIDIVIDAPESAGVIDRFLTFPEIESTLAAGKTRASVVLAKGLQVDLRVVPHASFGAALYYFTGSKEHNIVVRDRASKAGLLLNEYGLFEGKTRIAGESETSLLEALGLSYIPPELRENRGEIEAAESHTLPKLIELDDIQGELHCHSFASDGRHGIEQMAEAAQRLGLEYLAITDHSMRAAAGLSVERLRQQMREIDRLNEQLEGITLLKGVEVEILVDGTLELPDEILRQLDIVVCAANSFHHLKRDEQTQRILRAMDNPYCKILAHPTGRLLLQRDPAELDLVQIARKASDKGIFLEVNGHPDRLDLDGTGAKLSKDEGALLLVTCDAHSVADFEHLRLAIGQARRGWLEPKDVANARSLAQLRKLMHTGCQR